MIATATMNSVSYAHFAKLAADLKISVDQRLEWVENKVKEAREHEEKKVKEAREQNDRRHEEERKEQQRI